MKVCVVGSGGREHALASVLSRTCEVVVTPGNPGIPNSTSTDPENIEADLFVIGPEVPLVDGLADRLRSQGHLVFGPGADGAQIEGSKAWMKDLLAAAGVPTAAYGSFTDHAEALAFLDTMTAPFVLKTDGLAAGKGVLVTDDRETANAALKNYMSGDAFGDAGRTVVIEEGMTGPELSVFAVCDGTRAVPLIAAQDHKRVGDGDTGPNTGGMGAYAPVPFADDVLIEEVMRDFVDPTLAELQARGIDYRGVLFAGLMLTPNGLRLIEYNCRFGDPETQVVMPLFESDLATLLHQAASGQIEDDPVFSSDAMVTVIAASEGYPTATRTGDVISGLEAADGVEGAVVFAAGVNTNSDNQLITSGGRVLNVCGRAATPTEARQRAYEAVEKISWPGMHHRSDIGASLP